MRLHPRASRRNADLLVVFWEPGRHSEYSEGRTINVSSSGIFVSTSDPMPPPSRLSIRLLLDPDTKLDFDAVVVRTMGQIDHRGETRAGMGLKFLVPEPEVLRQLKAYRPPTGEFILPVADTSSTT